MARRRTDLILRINYDKDTERIQLIVLNEERFFKKGFETSTFGFNEKEISLHPDALASLLNCHYKADQVLELFADKNIKWHSRSPVLSIPYDKISRRSGAEQWLKQCTIEETCIKADEITKRI